MRFSAFKSIVPLSVFWLLASSTVSAGEESALYEEAVKIFAQPKISLTVDSHIQFSEDTFEERSFFLAKYDQDARRSLLIRFLEPDDIKCTAVLINSDVGTTQRYAYFPALKRLRVIPDSEKGNEVFGIGISYEDLGEPQGRFEPLETVELNGRLSYQLTMLEGDRKEVYFIDKNSHQFYQMRVYKGRELQKKVIINEMQPFFGEPLITSWQIEYPSSGKKISYRVRKNSVSQAFSGEIFQKNKLKRCRTL
ncbi:outer membrane lipoprotein-sorting protein [Thiomicrorhabdus sp. 6S3-12]|uniref:outer membrane lipoprotein-sorting protein n=1 Tax=Thiomicrorhabdus sp. 6S3-12 TaxID=2819681 RepID=UPI001AAC7620|nr:outer membrane lipoprotein-sorting protein [Thiomicrorhabdus sp. 6S3-12]MBO1925010.1 outer membrane lipoprotein-sorting protein [Thiomicrorhabdus sp. 6S3-12]